MIGAFHVGNEGMIHSNFFNDHPSNPHSHPFPAFSTSKKTMRKRGQDTGGDLQSLILERHRILYVVLYCTIIMYVSMCASVVFIWSPVFKRDD